MLQFTCNYLICELEQNLLSKQFQISFIILVCFNAWELRACLKKVNVIFAYEILRSIFYQVPLRIYLPHIVITEIVSLMSKNQQTEILKAGLQWLIDFTLLSIMFENVSLEEGVYIAG